ncbi:long-chain-fatty-acid--coa ligase [Holotrichia oblita]|uniref:Long-chain-fatty-acid--coa ligase n=1 Tax=Holotrichia oblita TaxID=644536 RepID=A0ACB9TX62_HOLOL|nr:long-chain-fatty-acid--coa ligase [Holotrichia oblita]
MSAGLPNFEVKRLNNILHGPEVKVNVDTRGLGAYLFEKFVEHAEETFQIDAATGDEETYGFVNKKCVRLALEMKNRGIQKNDVILVCSSNNMDSIVPILGTLYIQGISVTLDPTISLRDTTHLLKLIQPKIAFVEESSIELIESALSNSPFETKIIVMGNNKEYSTYAEFLKPNAEENSFTPKKVDDIKSTAIMFFSSGTTGLPKAIEISHYGIIYMVDSILAGIGKYTCAMHFTSFYWMTAVIITFLTIRTGGKKIVVKKFEAETALFYIQKYKIMNVFLPPSYTYHITEEAAKIYPCPELRAMTLGGSSISPEQLKKLRKYFPNCLVFVTYAQTEATGIITCYTPISYMKHKDKLTSSGQPWYNITLKIVNPDTEEVFGPNERGEIRIITPGLCNGYYNQDSSDMLDKDGFLKTGDVGYYDNDNFIHVCDRLKDMFKYQSWHIVPLSLENIIYEHPDVCEAIVIGIPQEVDGHIPMALVVLKDNPSNVTEEEMLNFANAKLLDREQLRGGLKFVRQLPKGTTGKISRKYIADLVVSDHVERIDNILYGPKQNIPIEERGLGRAIYNKMQEFKDRIMQINTSTGEQQTYADIHKKLIRIALEMQQRGIKANDIVLTCSYNSMDTILPIYSTLYLNAVIVNLDPSISLRDSMHLIKTISPKLIFVIPEALDLIERATANLEKKPQIVVMGVSKNYTTMSDFLKPHTYEDVFIPEDVSNIYNVCNIFFSSGTTGLPKAILHSNFSILTSCQRVRYETLKSVFFLISEINRIRQVIITTSCL